MTTDEPPETGHELPLPIPPTVEQVRELQAWLAPNLPRWESFALEWPWHVRDMNNAR